MRDAPAGVRLPLLDVLEDHEITFGCASMPTSA
jgi:hypothetical protein